MSALRSYRRLFSLTGVLYVLVAFLARLPLAMSQIGTLLLVADATGSYGAGGASAGALAVANAIGAPVAGALSDRIGQRRVVAVQSILGAALLGALVALTQTSVPWPVLAATAAASGLFLPQVGTMARVRWRPVAAQAGIVLPSKQRDLVDAAFSYEGAADEASFVLGPAAVGIFVWLADPGVALVVAAAVLLVFGTWFALHPTAQLTAGQPRVATGARLLTGSLLVLMTAQLVVGLVFGASQTGTSVLATEAGAPGLTGLMHALLGIGSVTAGLALVMLPTAFRYTSRLRIFATALLLLSLPLLVVDSLGALAIVLVFLGLAIAPYMITTFTLAERTAPPAHLAAAMTMLAATTGLGYALGSSLAGRLADLGGHTPAFAVVVGAGVLATLLTWTSAPLLRRAAGE